MTTATKSAKRVRPGAAHRPRKRPRAEKAALKKQSILEAALEEFTRQGFADARIEDVARRAGVGKGTVYLYFKDKQALFEGLVQELIVSPLASVHDARPGEAEAVGDLLRRTMPRAIALIANSRRGDLLRLLIGEGVRFPRLADSYRERVIEPNFGMLKALLQQAAGRGELANDKLVQFPQLLVAPAIVAVVWTGLFGRALPLDVEAMFKTHLDILFPRL